MYSCSQSLLARALAIVIVPAALVLATGAGDPPDDARARLQGMSPQRRTELANALKQFDLLLTTDQQKSIREIDQQISRLSAEDEVRYLAVLRRYHNWLDSLPDAERENLQAKPPEERMAHIKKTLISTYPLPSESGPGWMQFTDVAGASPFELAAKFKIWQGLTPEQRRELENMPAGAERRSKLLEFARDLKLPRELKPADFRVDDWIPKVEAKIDDIRTADPELKNAVAKAEAAASRRRKEAEEQVGHTVSPLMRRLAINLYFLEQPAPRPVDPQRLAQFLAAMPPWIRTAFDSYTADEARRRLTLVYRLVYPKGEFKPARPGTSLSTGTAASRRGPSPPPPVPVVPVAPRKEPLPPKAPQAPGSSLF